MAKLPKIIPVSELRADAAAALRDARAGKGPVIITQRGRATAVLLSIEQYEQTERERSVLRELVRGDREIARGKGHRLEDVLDEVEEMLSKDRS